MQDDHLRMSHCTDGTEVLVYVGQGIMSPGPDNNGLLYYLLTNPGLHCNAIQGVCWSEEIKAPDTIIQSHIIQIHIK